MALGIVSAVLRGCTRCPQRTCLSALGIFGINFRNFVLYSGLRTRILYLPSQHHVSSIHSITSVRAKVNLWDEYKRAKSCVEGNIIGTIALSHLMMLLLTQITPTITLTSNLHNLTLLG